MTLPEFMREFADFMTRNGRRDRSPWSLVEGYEALVDDLEEGYRDIEIEYTNDLRIRQILEDVFADVDLSRYEVPTSAMRDRVMVADDRLRQLFLEDVRIGSEGDPWWTRGVLARAGLRYAEDIKGLYGIEIDNVIAD